MLWTEALLSADTYTNFQNDDEVNTILPRKELSGCDNWTNHLNVKSVLLSDKNSNLSTVLRHICCSSLFLDIRVALTITSYGWFITERVLHNHCVIRTNMYELTLSLFKSRLYRIVFYARIFSNGIPFMCSVRKIVTLWLNVLTKKNWGNTVVLSIFVYHQARSIIRRTYKWDMYSVCILLSYVKWIVSQYWQVIIYVLIVWICTYDTLINGLYHLKDSV